MLCMFPFKFLGDFSYKIWMKKLYKCFPETRQEGLLGRHLVETPRASLSLRGRNPELFHLRLCQYNALDSFLLTSIPLASISTCTF